MKQRAAFHGWLVLVGAMYWWLIAWFASFWLRFVGLIIGRDRYNHLEQLLSFLRPTPIPIRVTVSSNDEDRLMLDFCPLTSDF